LKARILIVAGSEKRAKVLAEPLDFVELPVDAFSWRKRLSHTSNYRLLIWEASPRVKKPDAVLEKLPQDCHVVLLLPRLDVRWVSYYMAYPRINHFLGNPITKSDLRNVVEKLATGAIFGLERYLPDQANIQYRRVQSFKDRCSVLEEIDEYVQSRRLRGKIRRAAVHVGEELLMNAMYQAPVDEDGVRVFEDVEPNVRIRRRTPRPVSVRFVTARRSFFICVRDRYGTFKRDDLARYLFRCVTEEAPIEEKKLGAGLGLYQIASLATRMIVNILPGSVAEFICIVEPPSQDASPLRLLSVTTGSLSDTLSED
jgi:hypothetical protein